MQQLASTLHPLPSEAQQLAPALQQSAAQQLEPSVQQLESALHTLPSLQQLAFEVAATQQLAAPCFILHSLVEVGVSAAA